MEPNRLSRRSFLALTTIAAAGLTLKPAFGESQDLAYLTLKEASELVRRKTVSPVELTATCLKRIEAYNPALNAFITVTRDQAMETARAMEGEQRRGKWRGPLHGIPIALKDNIEYCGRSHHSRQRTVQGQGSIRRCGSGPKAEERGRGAPRQDEASRIRFGRNVGGQRLRAGAQPLGAGPDSRWDLPAPPSQPVATCAIWAPTSVLCPPENIVRRD